MEDEQDEVLDRQRGYACPGMQQSLGSGLATTCEGWREKNDLGLISEGLAESLGSGLAATCEGWK